MQQRIHRQQEGSLIYYTSDNITTKHLFTTKFGGVSKGYLASLNLGFNRGDERSNVLQNYQILADHFQVPRARMTMTKQIHSDIVRVVDENTMGMGLGQPMSWKADAIITNLPHVPLCGYYADCVVTLLHDPVSKSIGVCHSGWRGTASGIALKAAVSMMSCYGADPYTLRAAISPSIGKCCFETDSDVADAFFALLDPAMDERIEKRGDKYHIDLKAINRLWLLRAGIDPSRIDVHPDCTKCHPERYWSHRAMGDRRGGMAAMICLTEDAL